MKITRLQLRRLIEGVINEMPMLQPELLPPGFYITVEETTYTPGGHDWFVHSDGGPPEHEPMELLKIRMLDEKGVFKAELDMRYWKPEYCGGTWEVHRAYLRDGAPDGAGPMMYDIAMELAGNSGIMSDRMTTSDDAANVWAFYLDNRADVVTEPLVNCTGKEYRDFGDGRRMEFTEKKFIKSAGAPSIIAALGDKIRFV